MRAAVRLALLLWSLAILAATGLTLSQHPFAAPMVERSLDEARIVLARAVSARATPDWLIPRIETALAQDDMLMLQVLADLARDQKTPLPPDLQAQLDAAKQGGGILAGLANCGRCMGDMRDCPSLRLIALCTLPFELSPAGDAAALMRQGTAYVTGGDPDEIEAALAALGLAATAGTLLSGGSSLSIKMGVTTLRVARRARALTPGMTRALVAAARGPDPSRALGVVAGDLGQIKAATSAAEVLPILRLADTPAELTQLARLSSVTGPRTTRTLAVLGKSDSLRLLRRVSDLAMAAIGLIALVLGFLASALGSLLSMAMRRMLTPRRQARTRGIAGRREPPLFRPERA